MIFRQQQMNYRRSFMDKFTERTISDEDFEKVMGYLKDYLLACAIKYPPTSDCLPRWSHVRDIFGLGSTSGAKLCKVYGQNSEDMLGEPDERENYHD